MSPTIDGATPHDHREMSAGPAPRLQWVGLLFAPLVFAVHLQVGYVLVIWTCDHGRSSLWLHVAGALSVVLGAVGVWAAWATWRRAGDVSGEAGGTVPRTRFMGAAGLGMSALVTLLLLAQWVAVFVVPMCQ